MAVGTGKTSLLEEIKEKDIGIKKDLEFKEWSNFVEMEELVYPKLVRAFSAAATVDKKDILMQSKVKGKTTVLVEQYIGAALGIESIDAALYYSDDWYGHILIQKSEVLKMFNTRGELMSKNLGSYGKLVHNMCIHSLLPWVGTLEKVTDQDL